MMKTIKELFKALPESQVLNTLGQFFIRVDRDILFSNVNVVIGPNGAGKTRFLKAIRALYDKCGGYNVLYGYFPGLSEKRIRMKEQGLPDYALSETFTDETLSFEDFLKIIEIDCEAFLVGLQKFRSKNEKNRNLNAWERINEVLWKLNHRKLTQQNEELFISQENRPPEQLSSALSKFSPGELMLFYMAIFIMLKDNGTRKKVIILDEPEGHLHPSALLDFIRLLLKETSNVDIWIATHSLFVIPEVEFENLVFINDSCVEKRRGGIYQKILENILGENNEKTARFLTSISHWQCCEFLAECFTSPTVVSRIDSEDEQVKLFRTYIQFRRNWNILDFGGGSARLGLSMLAADPKMKEHLTYHILDEHPSYRGKEFPSFKRIEDLRSRKYDCIVMMNVLHEVPPQEWPKLFQDLAKHLKEEAYLVFVEAAILTKGEWPNENGYMVMSEEELQILFGCQAPLPSICLDDRQKSTFVLVKQPRLLSVTNSSVNEALDQLEKNAWVQLCKCRQGKNYESKPRNYAFWTQQYINARLYNEKHSMRNSVLGENDSQKEVKSKPNSARGILYSQDISLDTTNIGAYKALVNCVEAYESSDFSGLSIWEKMFFQELSKLKEDPKKHSMAMELQGAYDLIFGRSINKNRSKEQNTDNE